MNVLNILARLCRSGTEACRPALTLLPAIVLFAPGAQAGFLGYYSLANFTLTNTDADGFANAGPGDSIILTGGNSGSDLPGTTDLTIAAADTGSVSFSYQYGTLDFPGFDLAGFLYNSIFTELANSDGTSGTFIFPVAKGQTFGFRVATIDNTGEPGLLTISNFNAPEGVPEPGTAALLICGLSLAGLWRLKNLARWGRRCPLPAFAVVAAVAVSNLGAQQTAYTGTNATGQLLRVRTVNLRDTAATAPAAGLRVSSVSSLPAARSRAVLPEIPPGLTPRRLHPPLVTLGRFGPATSGAMSAVAVTPSLSIVPGGPGFGFLALTHRDQRLAANGNQFSVEPPNLSVAAGNGYVLEGVNNAVQVFSSSGVALLGRVLSSNEVFGVAPAIDRSTGVNGVFPTDMRVFYDQMIDRWFVLQRAQDFDTAGAALNSSRIYIAVSQSPDPTGTYNIYEIETTSVGTLGCPCVADYPQIGADQNGFYISTGLYSTGSLTFVRSQIHAVSKLALAAGDTAPTTYRILLPFTTGYEFALQPATTPPGASYFVGAGGVEYFVSSNGRQAADNRLSVWALHNTASLRTSMPALTLVQITVPTLTYEYPDVATQRPGPLPYGSTLIPPGALSYIDGGDTRVLSLSYAGGRLYATLGTQVTDDVGRRVVGGAYFVMSPTFRAGVLAALVLRQGYLSVRNNHLLRPAIAVNPQGRGTIALTLVGPDYFPSAAFVPVDTFSTSTTLHVPAAGAFPEDGFTGYSGGFGPGLARWGDYSGGVAASDGAIWMTMQYVPNAPRTELANWGTFVYRYLP